MIILLSFVCLILPHRSAMHYLCFVSIYDKFCLNAKLHLWRTLNPLLCQDIHHYASLRIIGIFLVKLIYHQFCNNVLVYKNLQIRFTSIFVLTNLFGNYFEDNLQAFGKTKHDLFNQLNDHRRYVELHEPKD